MLYKLQQTLETISDVKDAASREFRARVFTFQSSTASSKKMRIPTSRLMAMIQPTT